MSIRETSHFFGSGTNFTSNQGTQTHVLEEHSILVRFPTVNPKTTRLAHLSVTRSFFRIKWTRGRTFINIFSGSQGETRYEFDSNDASVQVTWIVAALILDIVNDLRQVISVFATLDTNPFSNFRNFSTFGRRTSSSRSSLKNLRHFRKWNQDQRLSSLTRIQAMAELGNFNSLSNLSWLVSFNVHITFQTITRNHRKNGKGLSAVLPFHDDSKQGQCRRPFPSLLSFAKPKFWVSHSGQQEWFGKGSSFLSSSLLQGLRITNTAVKSFQATFFSFRVKIIRLSFLSTAKTGSSNFSSSRCSLFCFILISNKVVIEQIISFVIIFIVIPYYSLNVKETGTFFLLLLLGFLDWFYFALLPSSGLFVLTFSKFSFTFTRRIINFTFTTGFRVRKLSFTFTSRLVAFVSLTLVKVHFPGLACSFV